MISYSLSSSRKFYCDESRLVYSLTGQSLVLSPSCVQGHHSSSLEQGGPDTSISSTSFGSNSLPSASFAQLAAAAAAVLPPAAAAAILAAAAAVDIELRLPL